MSLTNNTTEAYLSREPFRELLATPRFAGQGAFRPHIVLIGLAPLTLGSVLVDGVPYTSSLEALSFAVLVSLATAVVFFIVSGRLITLLVSQESFARTSLTVLVFGITEAIRTGVFSQSMVMSGADLEMLWPHRILGGSMTGMLVLGIVSLISVDRERYVAEYERLVDRQEQLARELESLNHTITRFIDDLTTNVREVVDTALRSVTSSQRAASTKEVVDEIVNVSENVVRPLSQEVSAALPQASTPSTLRPNVSTRRVFQLATLVAPFQPVGMPLVIFMLFFSASLFLVSPRVGIPLLTLTVIGVWANHFVGARFVQPRMSSWPIHWRVIVTTVMYSLGFYIALVAILIFRGYGTTLDRLGTLAYVLVIVSLVSWGVALIPAIREGQREIIADMHAATASLMQVRARNEVRLRRDKQRLSSVIHGDVQATLMATALKLQKDLYTGDAVVDVVNQTREAIMASLENVSGSIPTRTVETVQQTLTEFWDGLVTVSWVIPPELRHIVDSDDDLPEMLFQVLREAITNAAKHGRASHIRIEMSAPTGTHLVCRVYDNGSSDPTGAGQGAGTQFFHAVADQVIRERVNGETVLTLSIPLPQPIQVVSIS